MFLKASCLVLHFSNTILLTFLMMLPVTLMSWGTWFVATIRIGFWSWIWLRTEDWGRKWLVHFNTGKSQLALFYQTGRVCFRKIMHLRIGCFVEKALFERKYFFLTLNQTCQKQVPIKEDSTSTCPSVLSMCLFVKQTCPQIESKSSFSRAI